METSATADSSSESKSSSDETPAIDLLALRPEERDAAWFKHFYRGDDVPQLTLRAVLMGGLLGMAMSVSNLYTTLKLGWAFGVAITASVISFALWNVFVAIGLAKTRMTILENNCMQSTASSAGYSTGGTIATAVGAHLMITGDSGRLGWLPVTIWVLLVAALGVFLAVPMKRQMINHEQLPFPSGIAAAETLRSLYAQGEESVRKARALIAALFGGIVVGLLRSFEKIPEVIHLAFIKISLPSRNLTVSGTQLGMNFEPSFLLLAAGMIVGIRVSTSMLVGSLINYFVLTPMVLDLPDWTQRGKDFIGHMEVARPGGNLAAVKVLRWSLWFGTALMVSSGVTSFAMNWRTILRALTGIGKSNTDAPEAGAYRTGSKGEEDPMDRIEVPSRWMTMGLVPITIGLTLLCWFTFNMNPLLGVLSVVLAFVLSLVACRATGETDTTPIGAMGKITQFVYAVLAPADKTVNLLTAGITAGAAGSSADLLTDLKSGYLLGANPRKQFLAQFIGLFFGTVAVIPAWYLLVPNRAALEAFNSPATGMWYAVAEALASGINTIPSSARTAIVVGLVLGIAMPLIENKLPKNVRRFFPSSMGLGLAFVVPFQNALSFFLGAVLAEIWMKVSKSTGEKYIVPIASGAVAGESLAAAAFAIYKNAVG